MGISLRIFFVNDDDSIKRFQLARYERLLEGNPKERLPQYADKRVRYILLVVDLLNREPVEILRVQYSYLSFDSDGLIDPAKLREEVMLFIEIFPPEPIIRYPWDPVKPNRSLPGKCYDHENKWAPTQEIETSIVEAIFGVG